MTEKHADVVAGWCKLNPIFILLFSSKAFEVFLGGMRNSSLVGPLHINKIHHTFGLRPSLIWARAV
jgi:hypothetical protein